MIIVIDTTETFQHPLLTSPDWSYIQTFLNRDSATLVIPEIVILETVNHFPAKLSDALSETHRAIGKLKKLVPDAQIATPEFDLTDATSQFKDTFHARLKELRAHTPGFEKISITRVVQRSLQRRKPFDACGQRGLRDAIIWESVLELARTTEEDIVLVTSNTNDFGPDAGLASDLITDLEEINGAKDRVQICAGVRRFVASYVKPMLDRLDDLQIQMQEQRFDLFDIKDFFADAFERVTLAVEDHVRQWDFQELGRTTQSRFETPKLANLNTSPEDFEVGEVYRIDGGEIGFAIEFTVKGMIECDEIEDFDPRERPWTTQFVGGVTFKIRTSQVLEESTGQVNEFTIERVKIIPGFQWPYDDVD
jgi:hypothetical protein